MTTRAHRIRRVGTGALTALALVGTAPDAKADPPSRARVDAYGSVQASPLGITMLQAEGHTPYAVDGEALVWAGTGEDEPGDVAVAMVRARSPDGMGEVRAGRMMFMTGAVRPLHLDGIWLAGHAPWGTTLELFGGMPISAALSPAAYDWAVGQRLSQRVGSDGSFGVSFLEARDGGATADREVGIDAAVTPLPWADGALVLSTDLLTPGIADARATAAMHGKVGRIETFVTRRSPARLLPATSLFSALGDIPSDSLGASGTWRAAPRLDLFASLTVDSIAGELGAKQLLRGTLRLDDRGDGTWTVELRRQAAPETSWTGARTTLRLPIVDELFTASEVELVVPDIPRDRGRFWPYGLFALGYRPDPWELSAAVEGSASPSVTSAWGALFRFAGTWGGL